MIGILKSIGLLRCPSCRKGNLFPNKNWLDFSFTMNKNCSVCNLKFEREPGFFYGAMFVSYILSAFFSLGVVGFCILVLHINWEISLAIDIILLAIGFVYLFRISRSVWIHIIVPKKKI
jgi:uncharacterized protein (DUF983 family)